MNVDRSIVESYMQGNEDYSDNWLFYNISENGEYAFERPDSSKRIMVKEALDKIYNVLRDFKPYNTQLFSALFPLWHELINDINVILAVGCPAPYDAMVREYAGKQYMIFDLIRLLDYSKEGKEFLKLIRGLITHEVVHICIHNDYPVLPMTYRENLSYITFDEGFAHLLSLTEDIYTYNFHSMIQKYYLDAHEKLEKAFNEYDSDKQRVYLEESNCGTYWDKFAAISGKLYLANHLNELYDIYKSGPFIMISNMLGES